MRFIGRMQRTAVTFPGSARETGACAISPLLIWAVKFEPFQMARWNAFLYGTFIACLGDD